jgi:membrane protease subunit (stomatin/prohibitin family)
VSAEALDMVKSGQISGGLELMRWENQPAMQQQWGFTPAQQASLSFAWTVLKAIEQSASAAIYQAAARATGAPVNTGDTNFCTSCGARRAPGLYCSNCGHAF